MFFGFDHQPEHASVRFQTCVSPQRVCPDSLAVTQRYASFAVPSSSALGLRKLTQYRLGMTPIPINTN